MLVLLAFTIQQNTGGVAPPPARTALTGTVNSVQQKSNISLIFFLNLKTRVSYGAAVINSTGSSPCTKQPCIYSISLYSKESYNVTIQELVTMTLQGTRADFPRDCQAAPTPYTPTGSTATVLFQCNTSF